MQTILDEEEELIAAHKRQIEETMNTVRREMALVQEVDQPGSAIDKYVAGLSAVLAAKAASIADLQARAPRVVSWPRGESEGSAHWGERGSR